MPQRAPVSRVKAEALALPVLFVTNLLRVSEAITLRREEQGALEFFGFNNRGG